MRCHCRSILSLLNCVAFTLALVSSAHGAKPTDEASHVGEYLERVAEAKPVLWWDFEGQHPLVPQTHASLDPSALHTKPAGQVTTGQAGPRSPLFPLFGQANQAIALDGRGASVRYDDPGDNSLLDFTVGDTITMEAWVNLTRVTEGQQVYVIGKGRTNNDGYPRENQNYALRLRGVAGTARISFLFRSAGGEGKPSEYHRWNSQAGFSPGAGWHHVAVSYQFGKPESVRGWIDGTATTGAWDFGGATAKAPVVDNDQLWIGSAMGGNPSSSFAGKLDSIAIYRHALTDAQAASHFKIDAESLVRHLPTPAPGTVLVDVFEGAQANSFELPIQAESLQTFEQQQLAFVALPRKYNSSGVVADHAVPVMLRALMKRELPAGKYDVLLRSFDGARLLIDGKPIAQTKFIRSGGGGHESVPELAEVEDPNFYPASLGHSEKVVSVEIEAGEHLFQLEAIAGGKNNRPEIGELCVAIRAANAKDFTVLGATSTTSYPLTWESWQQLAELTAEHVERVNAEHRRAAARQEAAYWEQRRETARDIVLARPAIEIPAAQGNLPVNNEVDRFINAKLVQLKATPSQLTNDYQFIRRVSLDIRGIVPTPAEIEAFRNDAKPGRRERLIDRFLADPLWADHWVAYWQDVLAENPGILKPKLNNTGPFRFWIRESFVDNKPLDRFVTELLSMQGSKYYGGPAGFAMATENDAPMAAKAHVAAQAFLGVEMKCARCHDAPYHPYLQSDLFEIAAMLDGKPLKLPKSSTVPVAEGGRQPLVEITLKPGDTLQPKWPFAESVVGDELPAGFLRRQNSSRERLAALFTSPHNERFAQVAVNRLWQRYLGIGLVDPVDDWYDAEPSHPELLDYLARELVLSGYDLKHVARLILNSHTYQRQPTATSSLALTPELRTFAAPARRRLTAEQLIDSGFAIADKPFGAEELTLDPENRRPVSTFLSLGKPEHSWEFVSLSNERDRPALALPVAQTFLDALAMFGWRDSRQNPVTQREEAPTALQPLTLGNGIVGNRITTLSDDSAFTTLALEADTPEALIDATTKRILSRPATTAEQELFLALIQPEFEQRVVAGAKAVTKKEPRHMVSWSNHLSAEATSIKLKLEEAAMRGDVPTARLTDSWRRNMEDMVWALVNSPEFVFVP